VWHVACMQEMRNSDKTVVEKPDDMRRRGSHGNRWYYSWIRPNVACKFSFLNTKAVCKVRGLTLLHRVGTLRRCGDGLFFEVPPSASDVLLTTLHPFLENVLLQTVDHFEIYCFGAPFSWLEKPRNHMGRDLD
jgi:hypothetical protein